LTGCRSKNELPHLVSKDSITQMSASLQHERTSF
jgi:hypothetical protein